MFPHSLFNSTSFRALFRGFLPINFVVGVSANFSTLCLSALLDFLPTLVNSSSMFGIPLVRRSLVG